MQRGVDFPVANDRSSAGRLIRLLAGVVVLSLACAAPALADGGCGGGCGDGGHDMATGTGEEGEEGDGGGAGQSGGDGGDTSNIYGGSDGGAGGDQGRAGIGDPGEPGGSSSVGDSDGAGGGGGAHGFVWSSIIYDTYRGGGGGDGGTGYYGGGGGAGGWGAVLTGDDNYSSGELDVSIAGGKGGNGGSDVLIDSGDGGDGGTGGVGLYTDGANIQIILGATSTVTGGNGGDGGDSCPQGGGDAIGGPYDPPSGAGCDPGTTNSGVAGDGGNGGASVWYDGSGGTLTNYGTITGGNGGYHGDAFNGGSDGNPGEGGWGVYAGGGVTVVNNGTISGGYADGGNGGQAQAIFYYGNNNRLELWSGSVISGDVDATSGSGNTLALGGEGHGAFDLGLVGAANQYQGFEHFDKAGTSTWTVSGNAMFTGNATVSEGSLLVDGSLGAASTSVADGGTLGGTGTLASDLTVAAGGTVAPTGAETLTVDGNATFGAGSVLRIGGGGLSTTGAVVVSDGAVIHLVPGDYIGSTQEIVSAGGGITGTFAATHDFAFLDATLDHLASSVTLTLARNGVGFASVGDTSNHLATAPAIEGLGAGHQLHDAVVMLSEEDAQAAFDQLSGEAVQASAMAALIEDSSLVQDVIIARTLAAFEGVGAPALPEVAMAYWPMASESPAPLAAWATAFGGWGESDGDGNAAGLERSTAGILVGGDVPLSPDLRLGLFAGYSRSSFDADDRASSGDSNNLHLGVYGAAQLGALGLRLGGAYASHGVETQRTVTVGGFTDSLTADYDASTLQVFGEAGYRLDINGVSVEPFAGLAHVHLETEGFAEDGGPAALTGEGGSHGLTYTTIGARIATDFQVGDMPARASGAIGWRHAFGDVTVSAMQAFETGPVFTVSGTPIARDALVIEAGLDIDITDSATLGLGYDGQIGANTHDHALTGTLKVKF